MDAKNFVPRGIIPAMVTPLYEDESVNYDALKEHVDFLIKNGVHGVFVIGTTGEFYALSLEEKRNIIRAAIEAADKRVPVYAGTGGITTKEVVELTQMAEEEGVDAVSILTPMFISPSQDDLYKHFKTVAENTSLPVILYNNVPRTGVNISVKTVERLSEIDNIIGIKDSSGNFDLTSEYLRATRDNPYFHVLQGRDTHILAGLTYGATGAIAATSNVAPALVVEIYEKFMKGDTKGALDAQFRLAPLRMAFSLGTFPMVIKSALNMMGIKAGPCKSPVYDLTDSEKQELRSVLVNMGLVK